MTIKLTQLDRPPVCRQYGSAQYTEIWNRPKADEAMTPLQCKQQDENGPDGP